MAFKWKSDGKIFKGEGIYHITFNVSGRQKLLGEVRGIEDIDCCEDKQKQAWVELTPFGRAVDEILRHYDETHDGFKVCARFVVDDHVHVVLWVYKEIDKSILQIAYGMRVGFTHLAQEMGVWPKGVRVEGALHAEKGIGHIFEKQFVRTLSHKGQLNDMIKYVKENAYRKWVRKLKSNLFYIHKDTETKGLLFRSLGNHWLLEWPERRMVECSRSETQEDWDIKLAKVLSAARRGAITYTAAVNKGEAYIARKVREAGFPLVVLMMDGFPPAGSDNERFFKPGGVYFDTCAAGKLLLMESYPGNYSDQRIILATEDSLRKKSEKKGWRYQPIPHDTKRWRFVAGNEVLKIICEMGGARA